MRRNSSQSSRNNSYYDVAKLDKARRNAGLTVNGVALLLNMNRDTVRRVFKGNGTYKHVAPVAHYFKVKWKSLHDDVTPYSNRSHRASLTPIREKRAVN